MPHLPGAHGDENYGLGDGPPENAGVGAFAGLAETLFAVLEKNIRLIIRSTSALALLSRKILMAPPQIFY